MARVDTGIVTAAGFRGGHPVPNTDNFLLGVDGVVRWGMSGGVQESPTGGAGTLMAVCDGLGEGAELASNSVVRVMAKLYRPGSPRQPAQTLLDYVRRAHDSLHATASRAGPVRMGASLTLAWVLEDRVHWAQVGNTRLYLYRRGRLSRITPEHTHREFATRAGHTVPDEPDTLAQAMVAGSVGLGDDRRLHLEPGLDVGSEWLEVQDRLLLCTDGLVRGLDEVTISDVLRNTREPQDAAQGLVERARVHGSTDHVTAIVARVEGLPARTDPGPQRPGTGTTFL